MKTNQSHPWEDMRSVMTTVRAMIERQHSRLSQQQPHLLRLALNEAEALAWETGVPHLIFPTLAMEKVRSVADWQSRQKLVQRGEPRFAFAA
jgi:hypothetical protein